VPGRRAVFGRNVVSACCMMQRQDVEIVRLFGHRCKFRN